MKEAIVRGLILTGVFLAGVFYSNLSTYYYSYTTTRLQNVSNNIHVAEKKGPTADPSPDEHEPQTSSRRWVVRGSHTKMDNRSSYWNHLPDYKNPCWFAGKPSAENLRCLPYFYMLGTGKSGSTSLCKTLGVHPQIALAKEKEISYWDQLPRTPEDVIQNYTQMFRNATEEIFNSYHVHGRFEKYHDKVTFDCLPRNFWNLPLLPKQLLKVDRKTRFIIIMRQPSERLYSRYHHICLMNLTGRSCSAQGFHEIVQTSIRDFEKCRLTMNTAECCTKFTKYPIHVATSVYVGYIEVWLRTFPASQFVFIKAEDFFKNTTAVMTEVFDFLTLEPADAETVKALSKLVHTHVIPGANLMETPAANLSTTSSQTKTDWRQVWRAYKDDLWPQTKELLDRFYAPYNRMLADLLGDERFLFED